MNLKPLVSIVVPMYNVEAYLPKCVDSLLNQTLHDIEVVLVDDGSPDRCGEMAEEYATGDSRVRVVHRANGGLGPARNSGIDAATGQYVGFVDSDDWAEPDMFESLYVAAVQTGAQVVFTGVKSVRNGEIVEKREHPFADQTLEGNGPIFELRRSFYGAAPVRVKDDPVPISVWIGLYETAWVKANNLRFINIRSEDIFFNAIACRCATKVAAIPGVPYCYRNDGQSSITRAFDSKTSDSYLRLWRSLRLLGDTEPLAFRAEVQLRIDRNVIDGVRSLVRLVCNSSMSLAEKKRLVKSVLQQPVVRRACKGYPWWRLPTSQAVFLLCVRIHCTGAVMGLVRLKQCLKN